MADIKVRNIIIGKNKSQICVPVMGSSQNEILRQAENVVGLGPDIIEWRVDCLSIVRKEDIETTLPALRRIIGDIPLIFTFRTSKEGGNKRISDNDYYDVNILAAATGYVDLVDVEAFSRRHLAAELIRDLQDMDVKVIASCHDFEKTPAKDTIKNIFDEMDSYKPDLLKLAVMPKENEDVSNFIEASKKASEDYDSPIVTMAMGELGGVTRICTDLTGSTITFAAGEKASAPGQLPCKIVRRIFELKRNFRPDFNILLIGFMGTGKTTVSQAMSRITGLEEIDVDKYIVETEQMSIADIFSQKGENAFRDIETNALRELQKKKGFIISCGGGAVLRKENVEIMKKQGPIILLTATPEVIFERVRYNTDRPILNQNMSLEHVKKLMEARREAYEGAADIVIDTDISDRVMTSLDIMEKVISFKRS